MKSAKTYQFQRNNYVIDVKHELTNSGAAPLEAFAYFQLVRDTKLPDGDSAMVPTYTGAGWNVGDIVSLISPSTDWITTGWESHTIAAIQTNTGLVLDAPLPTLEIL